MKVDAIKKGINDSRTGLRSLIQARSNEGNLDGFSQLAKAAGKLDQFEAAIDDAVTAAQEKADKRKAKADAAAKEDKKK